VVGLEHSYGCGVAIDAVGAEIPQRTLRNISRNPNFGGEVMVVSLGCEAAARAPAAAGQLSHRRRARTRTGRVCLQDEAHVGFMSMIDSSCARPSSICAA
jgi:galactarate dehydratase